jgi:hypothetical protein
LRIHLSTALLLMLTASALLGLNTVLQRKTIEGVEVVLQHDGFQMYTVRRETVPPPDPFGSTIFACDMYHWLYTEQRGWPFVSWSGIGLLEGSWVASEDIEWVRSGDMWTAEVKPEAAPKYQLLIPGKSSAKWHRAGLLADAGIAFALLFLVAFVSEWWIWRSELRRSAV